jgi:predicted ATPase
MRAYALVELGDSEAIDVFLREEDAVRALEEALGDEPDGAARSASRRSSSTNDRSQ